MLSSLWQEAFIHVSIPNYPCLAGDYLTVTDFYLRPSCFRRLASAVFGYMQHHDTLELGIRRHRALRSLLHMLRTTSLTVGESSKAPVLSSTNNLFST